MIFAIFIGWLQFRIGRSILYTGRFWNSRRFGNFQKNECQNSRKMGFQVLIIF
jgi:hypothetical protein